MNYFYHFKLEEAYKMSMNSYGKALTSNSFDRGSANFRYRSAKMSLSRLSSTKVTFYSK